MWCVRLKAVFTKSAGCVCVCVCEIHGFLFYAMRENVNNVRYFPDRFLSCSDGELTRTIFPLIHVYVQPNEVTVLPTSLYGLMTSRCRN